MKSTCLEKIKTCLESYIKNYKLVSLLAMFVIANFIGSCSSTGTLLDHDRQKVRAIAYARAAEPFALMSALAYATNGVNAEMLLRRNALETQLGASGWHRDGTGRFFPTPNALNVGLSYDVWINEVSQPAIIVIAARGTEFKDLRDWQSNTWWLTRWFSDSNQYRVITLPTEAGRVFAAYEKEITNNQGSFS